jgi:cation diffusion facilitator CzcD-associated flavoprotein CzcO
MYFASRWPKKKVDFSGKRVNVIGTGSTGIQLIPHVAREAAHLTVFQRTANYSVPAQNGPMDPAHVKDFRARYREIRDAERSSWLGTYWSTFEVNTQAGRNVSNEDRLREYEWRWNRGGQGFMVAFSDIMTDLEVNKSCADFVRSKIQSIVKDPAKLEALLPPQEDAFACKRLCVDTGYFETYNQEHVQIVNLRKDPIVRVEATGVRTSKALWACDVLILATGFDAFTGALAKIDIRGISGDKLIDKWRAGPVSYLGILTAGFPNMFHVNGPLTVVGNGVTTTEMLVDRIVELVLYAEENNFATIDTSEEAENAWRDEVLETAKSMPILFGCKSWFVGANVPGKPSMFMMYFGGLATYHERCLNIAQDGYRGYKFAKKHTD